MKKWKIAAIAGGVVVVLGIGGYVAFDRFTGNNVTIGSVMPASGTASVQSEGAAVEAAAINGMWSIKQPDSKVYFSVTTSRETVNFVAAAVKGDWNLDIEDPSKMTANASVDLNSLSSGNDTRDEHVKEERYLDAAAHPQATFALSRFENFPAVWAEGETVSFDMHGTLTIKGISKDVIFKNEAVYSDGMIMLEGSTVVTFQDFGMENPHTVVLDTENEVTIELRLVLEKP